ncbi:MAG: methyltransferase domain-containing protein, partial [Gammaproteobacteria bacterium]|nr:methyltransferase domain-containing protein [Gammaproteobacteria bacterium]
MKAPVFDSNWSDEVKRVYDHDMREMWDKRIASHIYNMYHAQLEMYQSLVPKEAKRVLDVGCAQGTLALLLAEQGYSVMAVDLRQGFLDYAKTRWTHGDIVFKQGNVFDLGLKEKFDVIFANQIIEHLVYPQEMVEKLSALLNENGLLVMTTPNGKYFKNSQPSYTELGNPKDWEHMQFTADGDGHFFAYTPEELRDIFEKSGLKNIIVRSYETPWISGHIKFRYLHMVLPYCLLKWLDRFSKRLPFSRKFSHQ